MTTTETLNLPVWQGLVTADVAGTESVETEKIEQVGKVTDFSLAQAAAKGDMFSFEELYQRHHRRVYSICLRMLQNASEAEDLTQDVFIQLYRKIGSFRKKISDCSSPIPRQWYSVVAKSSTVSGLS